MASANEHRIELTRINSNRSNKSCYHRVNAVMNKETFKIKQLTSLFSKSGLGVCKFRQYMVQEGLHTFKGLHICLFSPSNKLLCSTKPVAGPDNPQQCRLQSKFHQK